MTAIAQLRAYLGLTQAELAKSLGISQPSLSEAERDEEGVSRDLALAILDRFRNELFGLGYTLEDLLRGRTAL